MIQIFYTHLLCCYQNYQKQNDAITIHRVCAALVTDASTRCVSMHRLEFDAFRYLLNRLRSRVGLITDCVETYLATFAITSIFQIVLNALFCAIPRSTHPDVFWNVLCLRSRRFSNCAECFMAKLSLQLLLQVAHFWLNFTIFRFDKTWGVKGSP